MSSVDNRSSTVTVKCADDSLDGTLISFSSKFVRDVPCYEQGLIIDCHMENALSFHETWLQSAPPVDMIKIESPKMEYVLHLPDVASGFAYYVIAMTVTPSISGCRVDMIMQTLSR